ncbi:TetR/AcrR family transcriptional regulator [Rhodococcus rhodnii]|uniref:TetR/AcrR family transcriptional regulator n=1 Tax=Rhodococcus rhodnii TaxID=38312 RepID=A0A6P2CI90_9NOCA|nr:TetR/AcrR family transcriptional regulator [Rhodococcus rhodnii]
MSTSNADSVDVGERILDAAASCVVDFGVERVALAEIARRAGVSRPTVYRRWPDTNAVLAELLTRRITSALADVPSRGPDRGALVQRIVDVAGVLRRDALIGAVLGSAPEFAMVYIARRLGTSQAIVVDALPAEIGRCQRDGTVRVGEPRTLAAMVLLITQSTVQSAQMVEGILDADALAAELSHSLNGYLAP